MERTATELFVWKDDYAFGMPDLDREHKALFAIARELHDAMASGSSRDILAGIHARLLAYTTFHFQREERFMRACEYAGTEDHVREHNHFLAELGSLERRLEQKDPLVDLDTLGFLNCWLENHILGSDRRLAAAAAGARAGS